MAATRPDFRERFGGSFAGGVGVVQKMQRLGFGRTRWQPHANGDDHLPTKPANLDDAKTWDFHWADAALDRNESHGLSSHIVLYPPPKWIMEKDNPLPTDMRWPANDPRWDDLKTETVWDKFVKSAVEHYKDRSVIFEIENEPDFDHWIDKKLGDKYAKFTIRTAMLIRATTPKARIMVDNVYGIPGALN
jgi:GH35 family endo-1,4-beta-xylanase